MSRIRGKDTSPELIVRRLATALGCRYRLHARELPGCPDIVNRPLKKIIFVHGCFWHMHNCRYGRVRPKTNAAFWRAKREGNQTRDRRNLRKLRRLGWSVLVIWECQLRRPDRVAARLRRFLKS